VGKVEPEKCIPCHKEVTPVVVKEFSRGAMGRILRQNRNVAKEIKEPGCADCHGTDHTIISTSKGIVQEETCGGCHTDEYQQHNKSGHAKPPGPGAWDNYINSRNVFLIPPDIRGSTCETCHSISGATDRKYLDPKGTAYNDRGVLVKRNGCDACHQRHEFSLESARRPEACMGCHSGGHSPDYENYLSSPHGAGYIANVTSVDFTSPAYMYNYSFPTCVYCHMVTRGDAGARLKHDMGIRSDAEYVTKCSECHETGFAEEAWSELGINKKYLEGLILENKYIIDYIKKNRLAEKEKLSIQKILWILQNEGVSKNIPCMTDIVSSFNSAVSGISHYSRPGYFSVGVLNLNKSITCFEDWYHLRKVISRVGWYVKVALILSGVAIFLIIFIPRRRPRRTTIEF